MGEMLIQARNRQTSRTGRFPKKSPLLAPLILAAAITFSTVPGKPVLAETPSFPRAMQSLRDKRFGKAAKELERRVSLGKEDNSTARKKKRTEREKMKLTPESASKIASHLLEHLPQMKNAKKLLSTMPRSTVELVRAVAERGVPLEDAEEIAEFLLKFTKLMRFGNLTQLDENHSHVIGRDWYQIDYSGEGVTWQQQKERWPAVENFKEARYICRYFKAASRYRPPKKRKFRYFKRIYKPARSFPHKKLNHYCK